MKLNDEGLNWIYQNIDKFKQAVIALDYCRNNHLVRTEAEEQADEQIHCLALSFLLVAMGEHIPKSLWQVDDFSVLYGILDENRNTDGMDLRDYE